MLRAAALFSDLGEGPRREPMEVGYLRRAVRGAGIALLPIVAVPASAFACTITCSPTPTECTCSGSGLCQITTSQTVSAGAVVDCSGRDVVVAGGGGSIQVTNGFVTVKANNLTINAQRFIKAERSGAAPFGVNVSVTGVLDVGGWISAKSNTGGGAIALEAGGNILISPGSAGGDGLNVDGTASNARGGSIKANSAGGNVVIDDPIYARAASTGVADGGSITIDAAGSVTVRAPVDALGRGAQSGTITLSAPVAVDVQNQVKAQGHGVNGDGGLVQLTGGTVTIALGAFVSAQGGVGALGGYSEGGSVRINAGSGGVSITDDINVTGGAAGAGLDGGAIVVESEGPVTVASTAMLLTKSDNSGGNGGDIILNSGGALTVNAATVDARGHSAGSNQGAGGAVTLTGCNVTINAGTTVNASGYHGGGVTLTGFETLTVSSQSSILATNSGQGTAGEIALRYRVDGKCSTEPTRGCAVAQCTANVCTNNSATPCTTANDCTGCLTGTCTAGNPDTGGTTSQFNPSPEKMEDRNLIDCP
jgi:hypothetical protein